MHTAQMFLKINLKIIFSFICKNHKEIKTEFNKNKIILKYLSFICSKS